MPDQVFIRRVYTSRDPMTLLSLVRLAQSWGLDLNTIFVGEGAQLWWNAPETPEEFELRVKLMREEYDLQSKREQEIYAALYEKFEGAPPERSPTLVEESA